jgi:uncharacterized membrane protein
MNKSRLEAFTDAVIAIIMTILVLELDTPESARWEALWELRFQFIPFLLSFVTLAIYWINHHHMFQASKHISGLVIWLNTLLILSLSLFPFTTKWMSDHVGGIAPEVSYAAVMLLANVVWLLLALALEKENGPASTIAKTLRKSGYKKSAYSIGVTLLGVILACFIPMAGLIACLLSLLPWVVPDKEIERLLDGEK